MNSIRLICCPETHTFSKREARGIILVAALLLSGTPALAQGHCSGQGTGNICPHLGGTGTMDGNLISYSCAPATLFAPAPSNPASNYGYQPSNLPGQPSPAMNRYWNTALGEANNSPTIVNVMGGGLSIICQSSPVGHMDIDTGFMGANSGGTASVGQGLVDGTLIPSKPPFNFVGLQFAYEAASVLAAGGASGTNTVTIVPPAGGTHWWPQAAPYTLYVSAPGGAHRHSVVAQTGTLETAAAGQPYSLTTSTRAPITYPAGTSAWAVGTDGHGDGMNGQIPSVCSVLGALSYMNRNRKTIGGNGHFILTGNSAGAWLIAMIRHYGKGLIAGGYCPTPVEGWDTSWVLDEVFPLNGVFDYGAYFELAAMTEGESSPCTPGRAPGEDRTGRALGPGSAALGTVSGTVTWNEYSPLGLPVRDPSALFTAARNASPQAGIPGFSTHNTYPMNPDGSFSRAWLHIGAADYAVGCAQQLNYARTVPNTGYRVIPGAGHEGGVFTGPGCNTGKPGVEQNCLTSQAMIDFINELKRLGTDATPPPPGGAVGSGPAGGH